MGNGGEATMPRHEALSTQDADADEYRCLIVEETPPAPHDT